MGVLVVAVLLVSLGIANTVSGTSFIPRQAATDPCINQTRAVPLHCTAAQKTLSLIANLTAQFRNDVDRLLALFKPAIGVFCGSNCLGPVLDLAQCQAQKENSTFNSTLLRLVCSSSNDDGTSCLLKVLSDASTNPWSLSHLDCGTTGTCNTTCRAAHQQVRDDLGCCAATWFQQGSFFASIETSFTNCRVTLGEQCPLPSSAVRVITLHITLLLIVSIIASLLA